MANEAIRTYGTTRTLEASGASCANAAVVQADDATLDLPTNDSNFPHARFVLTVAYGTNPTVGTLIELIAAEQDVDSTTDTNNPTAADRNKLVGGFVVFNQTAAQTLVCDVYDLPPKANYWLYNNTGQTISSTWTLKATPFTYKPA